MDLEVYDDYGQEQLPVLTPDEQLQALGYVARQRYGLDEKDMRPRPDERQQRAISFWVLERCSPLYLLGRIGRLGIW